jgi:hypothetical protein
MTGRFALLAQYCFFGIIDDVWGNDGKFEGWKTEKSCIFAL